MRRRLIKFAQKNKYLRRWIYNSGRKRSIWMYSKIKPYLKPADKILDLGSGTCNTIELLLEDGFDVIAADIEDLSFVDSIKPIIIDGNKLPFADNQFDIVLIVTVLHHTFCPEDVLVEAKKVARRIVIIEDIYKNLFQRYMTFIMDNLTNFEFGGNPHNNKTDQDWKRLFNKLDLKLLDAKNDPFWEFFENGIYYLKK